MSKWFCVKDDIDSSISMLAYIAGALVKANNPEIVASASPIAKGLLETIESGADKDSVNSILKQVTDTLLEKVEKTEVKVAIKAALSKVSYNADGDDLPSIDLPIIEALTTGFLEGLTA